VIGDYFPVETTEHVVAGVELLHHCVVVGIFRKVHTADQTEAHIVGEHAESEKAKQDSCQNHLFHTMFLQLLAFSMVEHRQDHDVSPGKSGISEKPAE